MTGSVMSHNHQDVTDSSCGNWVSFIAMPLSSCFGFGYDVKTGSRLCLVKVMSLKRFDNVSKMSELAL